MVEWGFLNQGALRFIKGGQRAAGLLPAGDGHTKFGSRFDWARTTGRQDAGSTLSETTMKRCALHHSPLCSR